MDCERGHGTSIREDRVVEGFTQIRVDGSMRVIISPGSEFSVQVEAQENLLPLIETRTDGDLLRIGTLECVWSSEEMMVFITMPDIELMEINGSGKIEVSAPFDLDRLELNIHGSGGILMMTEVESLAAHIAGSGDIRLEGGALKLYTRIAGSGNLNAYDFPVEDAMITIAGSGDARITAQSRLQASIEGSGNIIYQGSPEVRFSISGSGNVRKKD